MVDLETAGDGNLPIPGTQIGHGSYGLNATGIVQGNLNWNGPEEVVQSDPIGNESTARLEQNMNVSNHVVAGHAERLEDSLYRPLVYRIREDSVYLSGKIVSWSRH